MYRNTSTKLKHFFPFNNRIEVPRMGERPMMTEAMADLTCWFPSVTSSLTQGSRCVMITSSCDQQTFMMKIIGQSQKC